MTRTRTLRTTTRRKTMNRTWRRRPASSVVRRRPLAPFDEAHRGVPEEGAHVRAVERGVMMALPISQRCGGARFDPFGRAVASHKCIERQSRQRLPLCGRLASSVARACSPGAAARATTLLRASVIIIPQSSPINHQSIIKLRSSIVYTFLYQAWNYSLLCRFIFKPRMLLLL